MATRKEWNQGQWEESVQSVQTSLATAFNSKTLELQWLNSLAIREQLVNRLHQEIQYNGLIHSISSSYLFFYCCNIVFKQLQDPPEE